MSEIEPAEDFANGDDEEALSGSEELGRTSEDIIKAQSESAIAEKSAQEVRDEVTQLADQSRQQATAVMDRFGQKIGVPNLSEQVDEMQKTGKVPSDPKVVKALDTVVKTASDGVQKIAKNPTLKEKFDEFLKQNEGKMIIGAVLLGGVMEGISQLLQRVIDKKLQNCYQYNLNPKGSYSLKAVPNCNDPGLCNCTHISQCGQPPCSSNFYYAWNNYDMNVIIASIPDIAAKTWNNPDFMKSADLMPQILIFIGVVIFIVLSGFLTYRLYLRESKKIL